jgi:hypothetical protein
MTKGTPPPSLLTGESEYRKLCDAWGGPVPLADFPDADRFERACEKVPYSAVADFLNPHAVDDTQAKRHWPWVALAVSRYGFQTREHERYRHTELTPTQIVDLLQRIDTGARGLLANLSTLQETANRLPVPGQPTVRAHLAWLDSFLSQAVAGEPAPDLDDSDAAMFRHAARRAQLTEGLTLLSAAAEVARDRVQSDLLTRTRAGENPALIEFVHSLALIWTHMTGRPASANKVKGGEREPDFVVLVASLSALACDTSITRVKVQTALRTLKSG